MKTLLCTTVLTFLFISSLVSASDKEHKHEEHKHDELAQTKQVPGTEGAVCENIIKVQVNGLVCDFCARALEKVFGKRDDVSGINVDLDNGNVSIAMKNGKSIDDKTVTDLITDSGYNVVAIDKGC